MLQSCLDDFERRVRGDKQLRLRLARALFDKEEAILPEDDVWEAASHSYHEKCAVAVLTELIGALRAGLSESASKDGAILRT